MSEFDEYDASHEDFEDYKSKSQIKREMHALQKLGETLVELPEKQLKKIPLPDELADAVYAARKITSYSARKRQLQYIGKVMRRIDAEPIEAALESLEQGHKQQTRRFHQLETLRDRLISEGDTALSDVLETYPAADRQQLRQLIRNAQKEASANKPPSHSRKLFRYLRELDEQG